MADDQKNASLPTVDLADMLKGAPKALEGAKNIKGLIDGLASFGGGAEGGGGKKLNLAKAGLDALAYFGDSSLKGSRETVALKNAVLESGNPYGFTINELKDRARQMRGENGTQAHATEVLAALVTTGKVGRGAIREVGDATMALNRVKGVPTDKAVDSFVSLRNEPTKKSIELNQEGTPYLSLQEIRTIGQLEKRGNVEEAGSLAQKAFARKINQIAQESAANRILPDRALSFANDKVKRLDDSVRDLGRDESIQRQIDWARKLYQDQLQLETSGKSKSGLPIALVSRGISADERRQTLETLEESQRQDRRAALAKAENTVRVRKETAAFGEEWEAGNGGKKADNPSAGTRTDAGTKRVVTRGTAHAQASVPSGIQHAQGDGLQSCIVMACGCKAGTSEQKNQSGLKDQANKASQSQATASEAADRASADPEQVRQAALLESMRKATSGVLDQTTALDAQNTAHGKTKSALKELNIAQLERQYQDLDNTEQVIPGYLEALGARIEAEKELLKITRNSEGIEAADKEKSKRDAKATKMSDDIGGAFREGFVNLLEGKENALDKMGESLKKKIVSSIADALYDTSLKPAVEAFSGWFSGLFKGGSSGGGALGGESSGSNWLGSLVNGVMKFFVTSANGNVFASPGLHTYANSVVGKPTFFPFANGIGLMGEAGPEAIMPLRRGSDGRLGVSAQGASGGGALHYAPSTVFHIDSRSDRGAVMADLDRALQANNQGQMEQLKRMRVVPQ